MSQQPPDFIPDSAMPDFVSDEEMVRLEAPPQRSAVSRFFEPIVGAASNLGHAAVEQGQGLVEAAMGRPQRLIDTNVAAAKALWDAQAGQAQRARAALESGNTSEGIGRAAAAAIPVIGPAAADIGDAAGSGNVAGALGQAALLAAPEARLPEAATAKIASLLKRQAARRIFAVMDPTLKRVATAEEIAPEVAMGTKGREALGGIGVGSRDELAKRAKARAQLAGQEVESYRNSTTPVDTTPVSGALRKRAADMETVPPDREVTSEVPSGILDASGQPIMHEVVETVKGTPTTQNPALVNALRNQAAWFEDLAAQYDNGEVPAGELFKQRASLGQRVGNSAYEKLPDEDLAAAKEAGRIARGETTDLLHQAEPGSEVADRSYRVARNAYANFERARRSGLTNKGLKGLKDLLTGRVIGRGLAGFGAGAHFAGPLGGVIGAGLGVYLGESAYWGSLRAATYGELSRMLNAGELQGAAKLINQTATSYAISKASADRDRNRRAQEALQSQGEGVVAP